ncbi:MAG TPA: ATP-binding protein [Candidatus Limnocylindria bacterium]|nr:ATP-binding protein [Candidatus Limnocylindria bacterium]
MTAQDFLSAISQLIYLVLFAISTVRLARLRTLVALDTFLFFGAIALILLLGDVTALLGLADEAWVGALSWIGLAALPFLLLRLADDFQPRPSWVMVTATVASVAVAGLGVLVPQPWPTPVVLVLIVDFVAFGAYASFAFLQAAAKTRAATQRRMQAVALGSGLIAAIIALGGVSLAFQEPPEWIGLTSQVLSLAAVTAYFVGFAPPAILQRGWQEPAIRSALATAPELVRLADPHDIGAEIAAAALEATGAEGSAVGLWDEAAGVLQFRQPSGELQAVASGQAISGRAFAQQRPIITGRADRDAPDRADEYRRLGIRAIVSAPITSGDRRLGVLTVYAVRPPVFTDDAVAVVRMLAEQAALVLRSQELLREAAQVRAMAEMTRLKDDFLSVVAHDVRTPLTTILINSELLESTLGSDGRNAQRAGALRTEAERLKALVDDYLDIVSTEAGREARLAPGDLVQIARDALEGMPDQTSRVQLTGAAAVAGTFDAARIRQLVQNLAGNAVKYSNHGDPVEVRIWQEDGQAHLTVQDQGIGIPDEDLPLLFERFHRGSNTDDRRYRGLGLGLYICRLVAEEHGGTIRVASRVGEGTTFHVTLPLAAAAVPATGVADA